MNANGVLEGFGLILVIGGSLFLIVALVSIPALFYDKMACNRFGMTSEVETKFDFMGGCYVKVDDKFIPKKNWRVQNER